MNKDVWNYQQKIKNLLIYWNMTQWCNYKCSYCLQQHDKTKHAFNKYSPEIWLKKFNELQNPKLAFCITGGEPFLDKNNFYELLLGLTSMEKTDNIRIDTNGFWNPEDYSNLPLNKVYLMMSFHPEQVSLNDFVEKTKRCIDSGFNVAMVTLVMIPEFVPLYFEAKEKFGQIGIKLNPNIPVQLSKDEKEKIIEIIRPHLSIADLGYKSGKFSPQGEICYFPQVGILLDWEGNISDCCYRRIGNLFTSFPTLPDKPVYCKQTMCNCIGLYSMLEGFGRWNNSMNIIKEYVENGLT